MTSSADQSRPDKSRESNVTHVSPATIVSNPRFPAEPFFDFPARLLGFAASRFPL